MPLVEAVMRFKSIKVKRYLALEGKHGELSQSALSRSVFSD